MKLVATATWFGRAKVYVEDQFGGRFWLATFRTMEGANSYCASLLANPVRP